MDTPEFVSTSLHIITIFATPFHILGIYCILFQTPKAMSSVKWAMFNFHFWCMLLDWSLTILTVPFILFPAMAGFPLGILKDFGVPTDYQVYLIVTLISGKSHLFCKCAPMTITAVGASMKFIFENRYYIMFARETRWKHCRRLFLTINMFLYATFFIPALIMVPDQEEGLKHIYKV
uniref:Serpentine Receptor, class T n=1 Tax=Caenorhabditis tropicalis TaxID=1561998 RepID=A0A1I7V267_9PELO